MIDRALEVRGERTKKAAVTRALEGFIARRYRRSLHRLLRSAAPQLNTPL
ncbi:MAG: type II toxin-antitoxin system VapB family antitoxin [Casimicrobiaceae bacterium]